MPSRPDDLFPQPSGPLDGLVRRHLDGGARGVHADAILRRALARRPGRRLALGLPAALAAALVVALFAIQPGGRAQARPAEIVEQARQAHARPHDRSYHIHIEFSHAVRRRLPRLAGGIDERLWSRGDRFAVEANPDHPAWGRDERGRVWFALLPALGVLFDADEVLPGVREILTLRTVELPALLGEVLRSCDLKITPSPDLPAGVTRLVATPYPHTRHNLERAVLDIDTSSGTVRRLVLHRWLFGQPLATVTLDYVESRPQPDALYHLSSHLRPGAEVFDRRSPVRQRLRLLVRHHFGPLLRPEH